MPATEVAGVRAEVKVVEETMVAMAAVVKKGAAGRAAAEAAAKERAQLGSCTSPCMMRELSTEKPSMVGSSDLPFLPALRLDLPAVKPSSSSSGAASDSLPLLPRPAFCQSLLSPPM